MGSVGSAGSCCSPERASQARLGNAQRGGLQGAKGILLAGFALQLSLSSSCSLGSWEQRGDGHLPKALVS